MSMYALLCPKVKGRAPVAGGGGYISKLRGVRLLGGGGVGDLLFDIAEARVGADPYLIVRGLESLLALALGAATAEDRAEVAPKETQGDGDQGRARQREDSVYRDDRGQRRLGARACQHVRAEKHEANGGDQADEH